VDHSGGRTLDAEHVRESPQMKISLKIFERDSVSEFTTAALHKVVWHDFSDEAFFVVDLEGSTIGKPPNDDVVLAALALFSFVVYKRVVFPLFLYRCGCHRFSVFSSSDLFQFTSFDDHAYSHGKR